MTLAASGKSEFSTEYPTIEHISLGTKITLRDAGVEIDNKVLDFKRISNLLEVSVKSYKRVYEKYKSIAEEYNIELFFCDLLLNEACIDIARALKKPVVGFTSGLRGNYNYFF